MANPDATLVASLATKDRDATVETNAQPVYIASPYAATSTTYELTATDSAAGLQAATAPANALTGLNAVSVTLELSPGATIGDNFIAMAWAEAAGVLDSLSANLAGAISSIAISALARAGSESYTNVQWLTNTSTVTIYASSERSPIQEVAFKNRTSTAADIPISVTVREL